MRVAVTGATGNLGTSVLAALQEQADIEEIVGIARRQPLHQLDSLHARGRLWRLRLPLQVETEK